MYLTVHVHMLTEISCENALLFFCVLCEKNILAAFLATIRQIKQ